MREKSTHRVDPWGKLPVAPSIERHENKLQCYLLSGEKLLGRNLWLQLTPVLTRDNITRSFSARDSPPFIFILFLSRHFMAYLKRHQHCVSRGQWRVIHWPPTPTYEIENNKTLPLSKNIWKPRNFQQDRLLTEFIVAMPAIGSRLVNIFG